MLTQILREYGVVTVKQNQNHLSYGSKNGSKYLDLPRKRWTTVKPFLGWGHPTKYENMETGYIIL